MSAHEIELLQDVAKLLKAAAEKLEKATKVDDQCDYCGHRQSEGD